MENIAEKVGSFVGGKIVDAVAVASAVVVLRKGMTAPKLIAGVFAVYASAKKMDNFLVQKAEELLIYIWNKMG